MNHLQQMDSTCLSRYQLTQNALFIYANHHNFTQHLFSLNQTPFLESDSLLASVHLQCIIFTPLVGSMQSVTYSTASNQTRIVLSVEISTLTILCGMATDPDYINDTSLETLAWPTT